MIWYLSQASIVKSPSRYSLEYSMAFMATCLVGRPHVEHGAVTEVPSLLEVGSARDSVAISKFGATLYLALRRVCTHSDRGASSMRPGWRTPCVSRSGVAIPSS